MVSEKQLAANQRNARKSTGPRTTKGKAVASKNALKHGLLSSSEPVMDGENKKEFELFRGAMFTDLAPLGQLECLFVDRIAASAWRLPRAVRVEAKMLQGDYENGDVRLRENRKNLLEKQRPRRYNGHHTNLLVVYGCCSPIQLSRGWYLFGNDSFHLAT